MKYSIDPIINNLNYNNVNNNIKNSNFIRDLQNNNIALYENNKFFPEKNLTICSNRGTPLELNYNNYICNNKIISKENFFEIKEKNFTLFSQENCFIDSSNKTELCICPKNLRGVECELERPLICQLKKLTAKNKTQINPMDLLSNKDTFYNEYENNPKLFYLKSSLSPFDFSFDLNFNISIECTNIDFTEFNYTITYGEITEERFNISINDYLNNLTIQNKNENLTKFEYFINEKTLTVGLPLDIILRFKFYDMNSVMPFVTIYFPIVNNEKIKNQNLGDNPNKKNNIKYKNFISNLKSNFSN
jgi:hypothetical protein